LDNGRNLKHLKSKVAWVTQAVVNVGVTVVPGVWTLDSLIRMTGFDGRGRSGA
jgi:hypothetical protein